MAGRAFALVVVVVALVVPGDAFGAADFYASDGGSGDCQTPSTPCSLNTAATNAGMTSGGGNVHVIGALTRTTSFELPPSGATNPVHLIGSGNGAGGTLFDTGSGTGVTVHSGSSIENVRVHTTTGQGVVLEYGGSVVSSVVDAANGVTSVYGAGAPQPATVSGSTITSPGRAADVGNGTTGQSLLVQDSTLNGGQGINKIATVPVGVVVQRSTINASSVGITWQVNRDVRLLVSSSVIHMTGSGSVGVSAGSMGDFSSLVLVEDTIDGADATGDSSGVLIGPGSSSPATPIVATVNDSIVRGFAHDLHAQASGANTVPGGSINVARSDYATQIGDPPSGMGHPGSIGFGDGNLNLDPQFLNRAGGDYRVAAGSPVIDAAGSDPIDSADSESPTDRAGGPRVVDGNGDGVAARDMGAFEFVPAPAGPGGGNPPDTTAPIFTSASMAPKVFAVDRTAPAEVAVTARAKKPRKGTKFRYSLSEAARAVFTVERPAAGRKVGRTCRKPTRKNRKRHRCTRYRRVARFANASTAGPTVKRFSGRIGRASLKRGKYRVTLVATDAAGNRSKPKRLKFRVVRG
jgi:hypothetical protein